MLQPKHYPELLGKALVFEAEPFTTMVDDDNPWVEGLFMVVLMGLLVGLAHIFRILLTTAIMPNPDALLTALIQLSDSLVSTLKLDASTGAQLSAWVQQFVPLGTRVLGVTWTWQDFGWLILSPFLLVVQWLIFGLVTHGLAKGLGGEGRLTQTLGAVALIAAPQIFVLFTFVPFASVSRILLLVWSTLIVYRAVEVAHGLSWRKAAGVALAGPAVIILLTMFVSIIVAVIAAAVGGAA